MLTRGDIQAIAKASSELTVAALREDKSLYDFAIKRQRQNELLKRSHLSLKEIVDSGLLGKIDKGGLRYRCVKGIYTEGFDWFKDEKNRYRIMTICIKKERKSLGL